MTNKTRKIKIKIKRKIIQDKYYLTKEKNELA